MSPNIVALVAVDFRRPRSGLSLRDSHLVRALTTAGRVTVYCFAIHNQGPEGDFPATFRVHRVVNMPGAITSALLTGSMYHAKRFDYGRFGGDLLRALTQADVVYASMLYAAEFVSARLSQQPTRRPLVVWDTHNYDPDVWRLKADFGQLPERLLARREGRLAARGVRRALATSDVVLTCSEDDHYKLRHHRAGPARFVVVPNGADITDWRRAAELKGRGGTFVLFGSLSQPATRLGAIRFLRDVWPEFRMSRPYARLIIAGRDPDRSLTRLVAGTLGVSLIENPPDLPSVVAQAAVVVIPQPYGTGSKVKVVESLASGRPVIASPAAIIGLPGAARRWVDVASSVDEWHQLMDGATERGRPSLADLEQAATEWSWRSSEERLVAAVEQSLTVREDDNG